MLASSSADKTIKLWDVATGVSLPQADTLTQLSEFENAVNSVAFSPGGNVLASGAFPGVRFWDLKKGKVKILTRAEGKYNLGFYQVAFSPYGRLLAAACVELFVGRKTSWMNYSIRLFDVKKRKELKPLGAYNNVHTIAFASDGECWHQEARESTIRFWDIEKRTLLNFQYYAPHTMSLAFSPINNSQLAIGSGLGVFIVDLPHHRRQLADLPCRSVAFSPDGNLLAAGFGPRQNKTSEEKWTGKGLIILWNLKTGYLIKQFETPTYVNSVKFSSNGKALAAGCKDGSVMLWKVKQAK